MIPELYVWEDLCLCLYPKENSKFLKIWNFLTCAYFKNAKIACPIYIFEQNPCEQKFININKKMDIVLKFELPDEMEEDAFYFQLKYGV